jgi:hypothetical protein
LRIGFVLGMKPRRKAFSRVSMRIASGMGALRSF